MSDIKKIACKEHMPLIDVLRIFDEAHQHHLPGGIALVLGDDDTLIGTVSEGDIRRAQLSGMDLNNKVKDVMQTNPIAFPESYSIGDIIERIPNELALRNRRSRRYLGKIILKDEVGRPVRILEYHELWEQKVATHRHLVVVGLGYVGLTMAVVMADAGFQVTGVDVDQSKLDILSSGKSYIHEVGLENLIKEQIQNNFKVSAEVPEDGDVYIIAVGTPVLEAENGKKYPIMNYLNEACERIASKLTSGNLVVLRSTVPIGTCRNYVKESLEAHSGLKCGLDFHLSFAPERTAEGKALKELRSLPQIIGGYNRDSLEATAAIFRDLTSTIVKVESLEAAEMAKLINNSFRDYVFAYANQMAQIASCFNINVVDVIRAANEGYPRDPVPLPSPGVGGPCLTKDPHIFASVAEEFNFNNEIFIRGRKINESMHDMAFEAVMNELKSNGKDPAKCKIVVCGLAFKGNPETGDIRNSSGVEIAQLFQGKVAGVYGYDPIALEEEIREYGIEPVSLQDAFSNMDAALFLNNHKSFEKINVFEMTRTLNENPVIYDGWNLFHPDDIISAKPCSYLGLSFVKSSISK